MLRRSIYLGSTEPKCAGRKEVCSRAERCARNLVDAHRGRPVRDFTSGWMVRWVESSCPGWLDADHYRDAPVAPRPAHEAPMGIGRVRL